VAPEWRRPDQLVHLVEALRATEPRPARRWSELVAEVRQARRAEADVTASAAAPR
jgi:hypothetical protein